MNLVVWAAVGGDGVGENYIDDDTTASLERLQLSLIQQILYLFFEDVECQVLGNEIFYFTTKLISNRISANSTQTQADAGTCS